MHLGLLLLLGQRWDTTSQPCNAATKVGEAKIAREANLQTKSQGEDLLQKERRRRKIQPEDRKKTPLGRAKPATT